MCWEDALSDGDGSGTAVWRIADDGRRAGWLVKDGRDDDGVATGGSHDPAAWFQVPGVFLVTGGVGEVVNVVNLGSGKRNDEFCSVTTPLGKRMR
jgi:hypothetical protein